MTPPIPSATPPPYSPNPAYPPPHNAYPPPHNPYQAQQDAEHLKYLSIGAYVVGAMLMLIYSLFLMHVFMGLAILTGQFSADARGQVAPPFMGWMFLLIGLGAVLYGWIVGGFTIYMGRCLARREKKTLIFVVAALNCLFMPLGTILGIFTFVVLSRPNVSAQFR